MPLLLQRGSVKNCSEARLRKSYYQFITLCIRNIKRDSVLLRNRNCCYTQRKKLSEEQNLVFLFSLLLLWSKHGGWARSTNAPTTTLTLINVALTFDLDGEIGFAPLHEIFFSLLCLFSSLPFPLE